MIKKRKSISAGAALFWVPMNTNRSKCYPSFFNYEEPRLCVVEQYGSAWSLPKGSLGKNENLGDCVEREIREETGLENSEYTLIEGHTSEDISDPLDDDYLVPGMFEVVTRLSVAGTPKTKEIYYFVGLTFLDVTLMQSINDKCLEEHEGVGTTEEITAIEWVNFKMAKKLLPKKDYKAVKKLFTRLACDRFLAMGYSGGPQPKNYPYPEDLRLNEK